MTEVPGYLQDLLELVVGQRWPDGDEDRLRQVSAAWKQAASDLDGVRQGAGEGVSVLSQAARGPAHDAFSGYWAKTFDDGAAAGDGSGGGAMPALPWAVEFCGMMADACDNMALELETTKDMIIGQLVILFGEIAATTASAFFDFGASEAAVPEEVAVTRGVCGELLDSAVGRILEKILAGALEQALMQGGLDLAIQLKEIAEGNRRTVDWKETGQAAEGGAINGAIGEALGAGLGAAGGRVAEFAGSGLGKLTVGAVGGGLGAAATDLADTGSVSLSDVTKGALGGAAGAGLHLGSEAVTGRSALSGEPLAAHIPEQSTHLEPSGLSDLTTLQEPVGARSISDILSGRGTVHTDLTGAPAETASPFSADAGGIGAGGHLDSQATALAGFTQPHDTQTAGGGGTESGFGGPVGEAPPAVGAFGSGHGDAGATPVPPGGDLSGGFLGGGPEPLLTDPGRGLTGESVRRLTEDPAEALTGEPIRDLTGESTRGLTGESVRGLTEDPVRGLTDEPGAGRPEPLPDTRPGAQDPAAAEPRPGGPADPLRGEAVELAAPPAEPGGPRQSAPDPAREPAPQPEPGHTDLSGGENPTLERPQDPAAAAGAADEPGARPAVPGADPGGRPGQDPAVSGDPFAAPGVDPAGRPASPAGDARGSIPPRDASAPGAAAQPAGDGAARVEHPAARPDAPPAASDVRQGPNGRQDSNGPAPADGAARVPADLAAAGAARNLITAAAVPGSDFRGHAEAPSQTHVETLRGSVDDAMAQVGAGHGGIAVTRLDTGLYEVRDANGAFRIRVETQRIGDGTAARSVLNHDKNEHVIQLSDRLSAHNLDRAVAHEVGEIVADRSRYLVDGSDAFAADAGVLRPGELPVGAKLTPHDAGRVQELRVLGEDLAKLPPADSRTPEQQAAYDRLHQEGMALVEHLGLREGAPGAGPRHALVFDRLTPQGRQHVRGLLGDAGRAEDTLAPHDRQLLDSIRDRAAADQARFDARHAALQPAFDRPIALDGGKVSAEQAQALADQATNLRTENSKRTLAQLRGQAEPLKARGEYPKVRMEAGGGAALSGRDPRALLVDDRGRWQSDNGDRIAQTADQLRNLRETGIGDPYQFVGEGKAGDRVPLDALRYWEDSIAAQGPVIDGTAALRMEGGRILADIQPSDDSQPLTVEVEGTPVIASGFPPEIVPGIDRGVGGVHAAFGKTASALDALRTPEAGAAGAEIRRLPWHDPASAGEVLDILGRHGVDRSVLSPELNRSLDAMKYWQDTRADGSGRMLFGDEANLSGADPDAARHWVVLGVGGTAISGVENMLKISRDGATFTMVGRNPPPGLADNTQFREVREQHDLGYDPARPDSPSVAGPPWPNPGASGRLRIRFDPANDIAGVSPVAGPDGAVHFSVDGVQGEPAVGDGIIASLGSRNAVPPAVADLVDHAQSVSGRMLFDEDGQYLGYRLTVDGREIDVTGAASRFFPTDIFRAGAPRDPVPPLPDAATLPGGVFATPDSRYAAIPRRGQPQWADQTGSRRDAPPEGGNFDGGYVATATQTAHYAAWRRLFDH